ncbi:hypothetical protein PIB30_075510 [Stylosanthes scabra]|uniref:Uncharacterized protein n=1 Tax=Stylosanthes scabra TaxID=79078 RepID=A0ABU6VP23_9FABA|nr:hypothetical protein [Stylosanthes scabra]
MANVVRSSLFCAMIKVKSGHIGSIRLISVFLGLTQPSLVLAHPFRPFVEFPPKPSKTTDMSLNMCLVVLDADACVFKVDCASLGVRDLQKPLLAKPAILCWGHGLRKAAFFSGIIARAVDLQMVGLKSRCGRAEIEIVGSISRVEDLERRRYFKFDMMAESAGDMGNGCEEYIDKKSEGSDWFEEGDVIALDSAYVVVEDESTDFGDVIGLTSESILWKQFHTEDGAYEFFKRFGKFHGFGI